MGKNPKASSWRDKQLCNCCSPRLALCMQALLSLSSPALLECWWHTECAITHLEAQLDPSWSLRSHLGPAAACFPELSSEEHTCRPSAALSRPFLGQAWCPMKVFLFPDLMRQRCAPAEEPSQTLHGASRALCTHSAVNSQAERGSYCSYSFVSSQDCDSCRFALATLLKGAGTAAELHSVLLAQWPGEQQELCGTWELLSFLSISTGNSYNTQKDHKESQWELFFLQISKQMDFAPLHSYLYT